jgi:hypothetical protein
MTRMQPAPTSQTRRLCQHQTDAEPEEHAAVRHLSLPLP